MHTHHGVQCSKKGANAVHTKKKEWADSWGMRFNMKKCYIPRICRPRVPKQFTYQLMGQALSQVDKNPYLGVMWQQDLSWLTHINNIRGKTNNTLAFLRRNLKYCPRQLKSTAYTSCTNQSWPRILCSSLGPLQNNRV